MMTKDEELALDLALRSLKELVPDESDYAPAIQGQRKRQEKAIAAIAAIKQARALDKKADNARELGLDYEPADGTQVSKVWWDGEKLMAKPIPFVEFYKPVQQKPDHGDELTIAYMSGVHRGKELAVAQAVPDAFGTREGEHPQYIQGWNDCRAEMLSMRKRVKP